MSNRMNGRRTATATESENIDCTPGSNTSNSTQGRLLELGQQMGGVGDDIMKAQVHETVEQHLKKERALKGKGIKVLSLFFIDRVANYRVYNDDGTTALGKVGQWFEEAYRDLTAKPLYKGLIPFDVAELHNGYFSQDRKVITPIDTLRPEAHRSPTTRMPITSS